MGGESSRSSSHGSIKFFVAFPTPQEKLLEHVGTFTSMIDRTALDVLIELPTTGSALCVCAFETQGPVSPRVMRKICKSYNALSN